MQIEVVSGEIIGGGRGRGHGRRQCRLDDIRHACRDVVLQLGGVFEGADAPDAQSPRGRPRRGFALCEEQPATLSDTGKAVLIDLRTQDAIAASKHPGKPPHFRKRVGSCAVAEHPGGCDGGVVAPPALIVKGRFVPE